MTIRYTLRIEAPDSFDIEGSDNYDESVMESILLYADPRDDTLEKQVLRWLSVETTAAEDLINNDLPDGWYCKIEDMR